MLLIRLQCIYWNITAEEFKFFYIYIDIKLVAIDEYEFVYQNYVAHCVYSKLEAYCEGISL